MDLAAGTHNSGSVSCSPQVTITVGVLTVQSPASCTTGYAEYLGTIYKCDVVTPGSKCGPPFQVPVHIYYGGKCPEIDLTISGLSWDSWSAVPAAIAKQFQCVPPKKRETFDWSAGKPTPCASGTATLGFTPGDMLRAPDGTAYVLWRGEPGLPGLSPAANPFLTPYERAQSGSLEALPDALRQAILAQGEVPSAKLSGTVTIRRIPAGADKADYEDSIRFHGSITAEGTFDLESYSVALLEERPVVHFQRHTFDRLTYRRFSGGAEFGNVYPVTCRNFDRSLDYVRVLVVPVLQWMRDPAEIPRFDPAAGVDYVTDVEAALVRRRVARHGMDAEYRLDPDSSVPTITSVRYLDPDGLVFAAIELDTWTTLGDVRRPTEVRSTRVLPDGERIETTLSLDEVLAVKDISPSTAWPRSQDWQVWQPD